LFAEPVGNLKQDKYIVVLSFVVDVFFDYPQEGLYFKIGNYGIVIQYFGAVYFNRESIKAFQNVGEVILL
jgi:hypothetical protein